MKEGKGSRSYLINFEMPLCLHRHAGYRRNSGQFVDWFPVKEELFLNALKTTQNQTKAKPSAVHKEQIDPYIEPGEIQDI